MVDLTVNQNVNGSRARQDRSRAEHGALAHDRAFVNSAASSDKHIIFDDDRYCSHRLEHTANLRGGRNVHPFANLRTRTDERVAIYHRSLVDISAGVHKHRRHADNTRRDVCAVSDRRAAGNDPHVILDLRWTSRISIFVKESEALAHGHVSNSAHAKAEQQALFHPRVHLPLTARVSFRRTNFAAIECTLKLLEDISVVAGKLIAPACSKRFDLFTQWHARFP